KTRLALVEARGASTVSALPDLPPVRAQDAILAPPPTWLERYDLDERLEPVTAAPYSAQGDRRLLHNVARAHEVPAATAKEQAAREEFPTTRVHNPLRSETNVYLTAEQMPAALIYWRDKWQRKAKTRPAKRCEDLSCPCRDILPA